MLNCCKKSSKPSAWPNAALGWVNCLDNENGIGCCSNFKSSRGKRVPRSWRLLSYRLQVILCYAIDHALNDHQIVLSSCVPVLCPRAHQPLEAPSSTHRQDNSSHSTDPTKSIIRQRPVVQKYLCNHLGSAFIRPINSTLPFRPT